MWGQIKSTEHTAYRNKVSFIVVCNITNSVNKGGRQAKSKSSPFYLDVYDGLSISCTRAA